MADDLETRLDPTRPADWELLACALAVSGDGVLITSPGLEAPGPTIRYANAAMERLTSYSAAELVGATPRLLQGPGTDRTVLRDLKAALLRGESFSAEALNYRKDGCCYRVAWIIDPVRDGSGEIVAWVSVQRDVTEEHKTRVAEREAAARLHVLVGELQHRTRNLLGVVRAMAAKTARGSADLAEFERGFSDRLSALSRVQGLLSRPGESDRVTFDELIEGELLALDRAAERVDVDGPPGIRLRSTTVQTLALALHELATNALKHGALGQPDARLSVRWWLDRQEGGKAWLHVDWRERGVKMLPLADIEARRGQGRELIEQALRNQLGAQTSFGFEPDGVHCKMKLPVSAGN